MIIGCLRVADVLMSNCEGCRVACRLLNYRATGASDSWVAGLPDYRATGPRDISGYQVTRLPVTALPVDEICQYIGFAEVIEPARLLSLSDCWSGMI